MRTLHSLRLSILLLLAVSCSSGGVSLSDGASGDDATSFDMAGAVVRDLASGVCPITCAMVSCGQLACNTVCQVGSGCQDCVGLPCGNAGCFMGSGCTCAGALCISSGCPQGSGCH